MVAHVRRLCWIFVFALSLTVVHVAAAQGGDGANNPLPGGTTIHVVQPGETLFQIAIEYGTTVDAISGANGITDPQYITVGQRLLIPNAQLNAPGAPVTVLFRPGDSLDTLTRSYHASAGDIAASNFLTNPNQIYVGQELTI